jgi:hypothetical protein
MGIPIDLLPHTKEVREARCGRLDMLPPSREAQAHCVSREVAPRRWSAGMPTARSAVPLPQGDAPWADGWTSPTFVYDPHPDATGACRIFLLAIVLRAIKDAAGDGADAAEARQWLAGEAPFTREREALCALLAVVTPWAAEEWAACLAAYATGRRQVPAGVSVWVQGPAPGSGRPDQRPTACPRAIPPEDG